VLHDLQAVFEGATRRSRVTISVNGSADDDRDCDRHADGQDRCRHPGDTDPDHQANVSDPINDGYAQVAGLHRFLRRQVHG